MIAIGSRSILKATAKIPPGILLSDGNHEVLLPNKWVPVGLELGSELDVFVYTDSEDRPVATTQNPLAQVGDFAYLKVVDVTAQGAFLDWGLDKDLFVPNMEQHSPMHVGRSYVVAVYLDNRSNRVAAASRLGEFFDYDLTKVKADDPVTMIVYGFNERGAQVLVDDRFSGLVYQSETFQRLSIGETLKGFVSVVRPDNKLDIRLQRTGLGAQKDALQIVLSALKEAGGQIELGDKSSPEAIYERFGLSKKAFKAAVGSLYKLKLVDPGSQCTTLRTTDLDCDQQGSLHGSID